MPNHDCQGHWPQAAADHEAWGPCWGGHHGQITREMEEAQAQTWVTASKPGGLAPTPLAGRPLACSLK